LIQGLAGGPVKHLCSPILRRMESQKNRIEESIRAAKLGLLRTDRFLNSLAKLEYARQDPLSGRYSPTLKLFELGSTVLESRGMWEEIDPIVERLARDTEETVHLAVLDEGRMVYIRKIESTKTLRVSMRSKVGHSAPLHCTGVGKCLLAFAPVDVQQSVLRAPMERFTKDTITDVETLRAEFEAARRDGFALDNQEHNEGVRCVAAPVFGPGRRSVAAISVSGPTVRITDERVPELLSRVREAAEAISERLRTDHRFAARAPIISGE
jgi:IclR family transcriptional regulator, KDG regulon repressor